MKLKYCSSFNCNNYDCDYCPHCSHSTYFGSWTDPDGHKWRWTFNRYFGPLFVDEEGEELEDQYLGEDHIVWGGFDRWLKRSFKARDKSEV